MILTRAFLMQELMRIFTRMSCTDYSHHNTIPCLFSDVNDLILCESHFVEVRHKPLQLSHNTWQISSTCPIPILGICRDWK